MKKTHTLTANLWLLILRVSTGAGMLTHGFPKFQKLWTGGEISFADPLGLGEMTSLVLTVFAEFFCAIFIMLGLWTRWTVIPLIITMLTAAFIVHASDPFSRQETGILYLLCFVTLLVFGGGDFTLDRWFRNKKHR